MDPSFRLAACTGLILTFSLATRAPAAEANETLPADAQSVKAVYGREVERVLAPVQDKYATALEQRLRGHTTAGQIDEALAVRAEIESARQWGTLPLERFRSEAEGSVKNDEPAGEGGEAKETIKLPVDAQSLKQSYEREVERVLVPVQDSYRAALEPLVARHSSAGRIDEALAVRNEIEAARKWETLPLERFRAEARTRLNRDGFRQWLTTKRLSFRGINLVTLEFDEKQVRWITGGRPQAYDYRITGNRAATISGAQDFKVEFSDDLASGTFESNLGKYELTIEDRG